MKKVSLLLLALVMGLSASFCLVGTTFAEDEEKPTVDENGTSISLSPVSKVLQIASNSNYTDSFEVKNDGKSTIEIEVYAAPYSYVYSEEEDSYKLGFSNDNNFTQISRWITFQDNGGSWVKKANYDIEAGKTLSVDYKISTPDNIPAGGQYAVIFAHTLTSTISSSGIRTEASPGLVVYGRSTEGESKVSAEISDLKVERSVTENGITRNNFFASAKVKNTGNVDFSATGSLKIDAILGGASYETPANGARISVIPESELVLTDEWEDSPSFGLYKVSWTVKAGDQTEVVEKFVFVNPLPFVIISLIVLTIITIWIIIGVRKRKDRRSRLAI